MTCMTAFTPDVIKAWKFARIAHVGQRRKYTKAPYIRHPERVAWRMMEHSLCSPVVLQACFLHDVVEDTPVTFLDITMHFGSRVAELVRQLTKPPLDVHVGRRQKLDAVLNRIQDASEEARVIKLVDRIDNVWESRHVADTFTRRYLKESADLTDAIGLADPDLRAELLAEIKRAAR